MHGADVNEVIEGLRHSVSRWRAVALASWLVTLLGGVVLTTFLVAARREAELVRGEADLFQLKLALDKMNTLKGYPAAVLVGEGGQKAETGRELEKAPEK
jgi:hypothetical protein